MTISIVVNGGLFDTAEEAADSTQKEAIREKLMTDLVAKWAENGRKITHSQVVAVLVADGGTVDYAEDGVTPESVTQNGQTILVSEIWDVVSVADPTI